MAETDETYDPTPVEVDRGRQQGLGMGEKDLQRQRDPGDGLSEDERRTEVVEESDEDGGDGFGRAEPVAGQ